MIVPFSIACRDCGQCLHIGYRDGWGPTVLDAEPARIRALAFFLGCHRGHRLVFDDNLVSEVIDMEEIDYRKIS